MMIISYNDNLETTQQDTCCNHFHETLLLYIYDDLVIELNRCYISLLNKTFLVSYGREPGSFTYRVLIGRVSIFEHKQNAENVAHSLSIHRDRRCTDVYVCTPRHLTLDGEAFHCAVGHAFLRMPDWYAEVSSGMQRHPIFADRSRLRPANSGCCIPRRGLHRPVLRVHRGPPLRNRIRDSILPSSLRSLFPPLLIVSPSQRGHSRRIRIHPAPSARSIRITLHQHHRHRMELRR